MAKPPARRDGLPAPREGYAGFQVTGKTPLLWAKLRVRLVARFEQVIESLVEEDRGLNWLQERAKEFGRLAIDNVKARMRREGAEVEKIEAEVAKLFSEREKILAEAREANARASRIEVEVAKERLRLALGMTKAMLIGDDSDEAILFGRQIEAMLSAIRAVKETEGTASGAGG